MENLKSPDPEELQEIEKEAITRLREWLKKNGNIRGVRTLGAEWDIKLFPQEYRNIPDEHSDQEHQNDEGDNSQIDIIERPKGYRKELLFSEDFPENLSKGNVHVLYENVYTGGVNPKIGHYVMSDNGEMLLNTDAIHMYGMAFFSDTEWNPLNVDELLTIVSAIENLDQEELSRINKRNEQEEGLIKIGEKDISHFMQNLKSLDENAWAALLRRSVFAPYDLVEIFSRYLKLSSIFSEVVPPTEEEITVFAAGAYPINSRALEIASKIVHSRDFFESFNTIAKPIYQSYFIRCGEQNTHPLQLQETIRDFQEAEKEAERKNAITLDPPGLN